MKKVLVVLGLVILVGCGVAIAYPYLSNGNTRIPFSANISTKSTTSQSLKQDSSETTVDIDSENQTSTVDSTKETTTTDNNTIATGKSQMETSTPQPTPTPAPTIKPTYKYYADSHNVPDFGSMFSVKGMYLEKGTNRAYTYDLFGLPSDCLTQYTEALKTEGWTSYNTDDLETEIEGLLYIKTVNGRTQGVNISNSDSDIDIVLIKN